MELLVAPWKVLRPYSRFVTDWSHLEKVVGQIATVFLLLPEWINLMNPGDPIEIGDTDSFFIIAKGKVRFAKKIFAGDLLPQDLEQAICVALLPELMQQGKVKDHMVRMFREVYGEEIHSNTPIAVLGVHIEEVAIPEAESR